MAGDESEYCTHVSIIANNVAWGPRVLWFNFSSNALQYFLAKGILRPIQSVSVKASAAYIALDFYFFSKTEYLQARVYTLQRLCYVLQSFFRLDRKSSRLAPLFIPQESFFA